MWLYLNLALMAVLLPLLGLMESMGRGLRDAGEKVQQTIRPTTVDHLLEPDALRGSEWVLNHLQNTDGVEVRDMEQERREIQADAQATPAPTSTNVSQVAFTPSNSEPEWEAKARAAGWTREESKTDVAREQQLRREPVDTEPRELREQRERELESRSSDITINRERDAPPPPVHTIPPPAEPPV